MGEYVATPAMEEHVDLVVVGGGPTGLLSALLARRLGLTVSIVGWSLLAPPLPCTSTIANGMFKTQKLGLWTWEEQTHSMLGLSNTSRWSAYWKSFYPKA